MTNALFVDVGHTSQYLSHEVFDVPHGYGGVVLLGNLDNVLQVSGTILEDDILHLLAIIGLTVVDVEHLDTIFAIPQSFKHLKFPTDEFPRLGRALYCNFAIRVCVKRLKYVA